MTVIAIGGNTLSRGLTLEEQDWATSNASLGTTTLMQMGRGLVSQRMPPPPATGPQQLLHWFRELNVVERFRSGQEWMRANGLRPADYGPRIRLSPHLNITRASVISSVKLASRSVTTLLTRQCWTWTNLRFNKELCLSLVQMKNLYPAPMSDFHQRS